MKMVHLLHHDGMGGGPVVVNQLIRDFSREFSVSAVVGGRGKVTEACEEAGIPVYAIAIDRLWKCPLGFFQLAALLKKIKPDVLFLHGQWAGPLGAVAGKWAGVPVMIYVAHSPAFYHRQTLVNSVRSYFSESIPSRLSDAVVALSRGNVYQYMIRYLVEDNKLHLINNGLDLKVAEGEDAGNQIRSEWKWKPEHRHVLFLGRLDRQKGLSWLLRAWEIVIKTRSQVDLWIVGSGPLEQHLKQQARELGLLSNCHFLPDQPNGRRFIAAADIVVLPSLYEGHALVPLEAMAQGKAFAGTQVDGIVDSVRNGVEGLLVPAGDVEGLAKILGQLIDDPARGDELGKNGRERAKVFDWEISSKRYAELVWELLKNKTR